MFSTARLNRPVLFNQILDQQHITSSLKNAVKKKAIGQSILFYGPKGSGKTSCARILAKVLNCNTPTNDGEPCNLCKNCIEKTNSWLFELDAASNNSVENIRNIVDQIRYVPQHSLYTVFIIDEAHMLSNSAFNAFLKTLEEPPKYVMFILATTEKNKIIPTILSRCQIFEFKKIKKSTIRDYIIKNLDERKIKYEKEAITLIAEQSDGSMRDALSFLDSIVYFDIQNGIRYNDVLENLRMVNFSFFTELMHNIYYQNKVLIFSHINYLYEKEIDGQIFFQSFAKYLMDFLLTKNNLKHNLDDNVDILNTEKYRELLDIFSEKDLIDFLNLVVASDIIYKQSSCKNIVIELLLIKMLNLNCGKNLKEKINYFDFSTKNIKDNAFLNDKLEEQIVVNDITNEDKSNTKDLIQTAKVTQLIEEFANRIKNEGKYIDYSVLASKKKIKDNSIMFLLTNSIQESIFQSLKPCLERYLCEKLDIEFINIYATLVKSEVVKKEESSTLEKLKNKFDIVENIIDNFDLNIS